MKRHLNPEGANPSGCRGKVRYKTKRLAQGVLRVMLREGQMKSETLHVYRCPSCGKWHLGNRSGSVPPPLLTIRAAVGEVVEIVWMDAQKKIVTKTRHTAPKA